MAGALVAAGLALAPEAGAATTTLTVNASADTYTNASSTTTNYGSSSSLTTRTSPARWPSCGSRCRPSRRA